MDSGVLIQVFIFLVAACVVVPLASRFKLGSVLGYLIAGVAIGPFGFGFFSEAEHIMHFAEFGVVMMLFVIGLELEPASLWNLRKRIVGIGGAQMLVSTAALMLVGITLGYNWQTSVAVALALSLSSTALVLQTLEEKKLMHTDMGQTSFAVLLFQDIAVIPILVLMPLLAVKHADVSAHSTHYFSAFPGYVHALAIALAIALVVVIGRYVSGYIFSLIARARVREVFTATALAFVVGITLLMNLVGVSPALGAFIAGVVLANSEYRHTLESDLEPFKSLLLGLFFISVGMGMNFGLFESKPIELLLCVAGLMAIKALALLGIARFTKLSSLQRIGFALALCQGGEFGFVLIAMSGEMRLLSPDISAFLTLVVACSIAATPLLLLFYQRFITQRFMSVLPEKHFDKVERSERVIIAGYGRFGQIIGRFLTGQGVDVTILENDPEQVMLLRKFGVRGYYGDASREALLHSAHAEKANILVIAVDNADVCLAIARMAKKSYPHLKVFARARNRRHAYELYRLGVTEFKRETFDSALGLAKDVMVSLGHNESDMRFKAEQFKRHDEATLTESFAFFDDEPALVNYSRTRSDELARVLQSDAAGSDKD